jgi:nicotinamidase-related amidase
MYGSRGAPAVALSERVIPPAKRVLEAARRARMRIVHFRECYAPDLHDLNPYRRLRDTIVGERGPLGRFLISDADGSRIVDELSPLPGEPVIDKAGFSGFHRTRLDELLRANGITHVVLMGITTQCCVSSTVRGAVDYGYVPLVLEDCCGAYDPADHAASIRVIYSENHNFGWVSDSARFVAALGA